jgi:hypothetical protein
VAVLHVVALALRPRHPSKFNFPTVNELLLNINTRMPTPMPWGMLLGGPDGLKVPAVGALWDVDGGSKPLPALLTNDYRKE